MKFILFFLLTFLSVITLNSSNSPVELAKININLIELSKNHQLKTVEFFTSTKKKIGKFSCLDVSQIFENNIKQLSISERKRLVIIAESSNGDAVTADYFDFDKNNVKMQPLIICSTVKGITGDTAVISDVKGKIGKVDLSMVDKELQKAITERIYLQISSISDIDRQKYFKEGTLIFPQDQTCNRWLENIISLNLYIIK